MSNQLVRVLALARVIRFYARALIGQKPMFYQSIKL